MGACFAHPAVAATGKCDACGTPICMRCTKGTLDGFMCPPCAHKRYGRAKLITGLKVAGVAAVVIGLAIAGLVLVGHGNRTTPPPKKVERDRDPVIAALLVERDQAPCDKRLIRKLADELGRADRYGDVVDQASAFFAKCGPFPRLEWSVVYALQQLGRYAEAVKHETVIIEDDPFDGDYWWWRGEDRGRSNQPELALADYRQSFANSDSAAGGKFAAARVLDVAGPASRPCDGVWALRYFRDHLGGEVSDDVARRVDGVRQASQCDGQAGRGALTVVPSAADASLRVEVTVGAATGSFLVDPRCGTTALASAFAAKAQVTGRGVTIQTVAANVLRTGAAATAPVTAGGASAPAVELVIVDGLPAGTDGVLGLSFLWLFPAIALEDGVAVTDQPPAP